MTAWRASTGSDTSWRVLMADDVSDVLARKTFYITIAGVIAFALGVFAFIL